MADWLKSLRGRIVVYLYPLCTLLFIELLMRTLVSSKGSLTFIGPTLAAIGVSFVLPLTTKRSKTKEEQKKRLRMRQGKISQELINKLEEVINKEDELLKGGVSIQLAEEEDFMLAGWLMTTLLFTPVWVYALYLSIKFPDGFLWIFPCSFYPGFFNYVFGFGLSELREGA